MFGDVLETSCKGEMCNNGYCIDRQHCCLANEERPRLLEVKEHL